MEGHTERDGVYVVTRPGFCLVTSEAERVAKSASGECRPSVSVCFKLMEIGRMLGQRVNLGSFLR